jgi:hypothetical protein
MKSGRNPQGSSCQFSVPVTAKRRNDISQYGGLGLPGRSAVPSFPSLGVRRGAHRHE